jgi:hypothetical protein
VEGNYQRNECGVIDRLAVTIEQSLALLSEGQEPFLVDKRITFTVECRMRHSGRWRSNSGIAQKMPQFIHQFHSDSQRLFLDKQDTELIDISHTRGQH